MNKKILGLDLGTNSIGWALVEQDFENKAGEILGMGSRIIPMSQDILGDFGKGNSVSQTAERTGYRSVRRLRERHLLRRERLHRVLNVLGFLPEHYANQIDFEKRLGKFVEETEPKLAWKKGEEGKFSFLFESSFDEMVADFKANKQEIKIPYDWTIYYLRKKALTQKITKEELAWLILNFNQKRGYYQLRGEDFEEEKDKVFVRLKVDRIVDTGNTVKGKILYDVFFENGWKYDKQIVKTKDWIGRIKEFIVTESLLKNGETKRSFKAVDSQKDWIAIKTQTEQEIDQSNKTVGTYIYETLLKNPTQKIRGKLVRTIERKFYNEELKRIIETQIALQPELFTDELYNDCIRELYRSNEAHQLQLSKRDFVHLFLNDIIFYQRPLRSQKSSIGNCSLEFRRYKVNGEERKEYLKAIPKSNPYYQEFRIWQWMYNLSVYKEEDGGNVTPEFLNNIEDFESLFEFLNNRKEIEQKPLIKYFLERKGLKGKLLNAEIEKYRWNYVEDKKYPCNETGTLIRSRLEKVPNVVDGAFLTKEIEYKLWHIIYSVTDKLEFEKALGSFAGKYALDKTSFVESFKKFPPFKSDYGSYSEKAIKKLLPLMRIGKYWKWENIDAKTQARIDKILTGEFDEEIKDRVREKAISLRNETDFQGLPLWLASYLVYGRHSEAGAAAKWKSADELDDFLKEFKQHSLRNPIVEQVITETLRVVKDIWNKYGKGTKDFFDEIHIELGREMKNNAEDRKRITNQISENENTNLRIKALLAELKNDSNIENVRPHSPMQQEILKVYEEYAISSSEKYNSSTNEFIAEEIPEDILKISKTAQPSKSELIRYKLWLEQKYRSPYTGEMIPLSRLFTPAYEIEHIIPQSRYFDDSFSNKVICEAAVNKEKGNQLGLEFIKARHGEIIPTGFGGTVKIFTEDEYKDFVTKHYEKSWGKKNKLLLEEIPDKMIERQMNDTRYISRYITTLLSGIVREEKDDDGVNSKNIIPGNGKITAQLKQDWGLNDVWNELILPRFERMNVLTNTTAFTSTNANNKIIPTVPLELSKGFQKKRIDHRHHALDALVIACATRDHVNLLNNQSAKSETKRYDLQYKLRNTEKWTDKNEKERTKFTTFKKPWQTFTQDARNELEKIVVSFKQNLRVINKASNTYQKFENGKKVNKKQEGTNWAIRQSLNEETISGIVNLPWVKVGKDEFTTATRKTLDISFNLDKIEKITDTGIQEILRNYLRQERFKYKEKDEIKYNPELAFSPEGIGDLNKNISLYNNGKFHQPIFKVRMYEKGKGRFILGRKGNKKTKYVQGAPNLFFAVYEDDNGKRIFETIPLNEVIEHQKQQVDQKSAKEIRTELPIKPANGKFVFHLSPNDLVYVPTKEELDSNSKIDFENLTSEQRKRLYNVNDFSSTCYFSPNSIAKAIAPKEVDLSYNKKKNKTTGSFDTKTASLDDMQIKDICIKLQVDRLGNISPIKEKANNQGEGLSSIVSEPEIAYTKSNLKTFSSFKEADEENAKSMAELSPEEHLKNVTERIQKTHEDELQKPMDKKIKFRK